MVLEWDQELGLESVQKLVLVLALVLAQVLAQALVQVSVLGSDPRLDWGLGQVLGQE